MAVRSLALLSLVLFVQIPLAHTGQQDLESCRAENKRLSETIRNLKRQLDGFDDQLSGLNKQLVAAKRDIDECRAQKDQPSGSNSELNALRQQLSSVRDHLRACEQETEKLSASNSTLNSQLAELKRSQGQGQPNLDQQLNEARNNAERCKRQNEQLSIQLRELQQRLINQDQQLNAARNELERCKGQSATASTQLRELQQHLTNQDQQLSSKDKELQTSKQTISDLSKQVLAEGQVPANAEALITLAQSSQQQTNQDNQPVISTYVENGKVHIIRELVIGTLTTTYDTVVKPGRPFPVKAVFKPHPIITPGTLSQSATEEVIGWSIELEYPSQKSKVTYDKNQSGQKPLKRPIDATGAEETWIWDVNPPADFDSDVSDLILYAGYETGGKAGRKDIVRENVKFTQVKEPGAFTKALAFTKENLTYILGVLSLGIGIWGTVIKIKNDKLELKLKEKEQQEQQPKETGPLTQT